MGTDQAATARAAVLAGSHEEGSADAEEEEKLAVEEEEDCVRHEPDC